MDGDSETFMSLNFGMAKKIIRKKYALKQLITDISPPHSQQSHFTAMFNKHFSEIFTNKNIRIINHQIP